MRNLQPKLYAVLLTFCVLACQESEIQPDSLEDHDMQEAWLMANDFLSSSRTESTDEDVTVIRYEQNLAYKTNVVTGSYEPINEETITAESHPGGFVFWYAGGGVKSLIEIEFDAASEALLGDYLPFEVVPGEMWALYITSDFDTNHELLKYDIIYENNDGEIIRLDPKIQVKQDDE